MSSYSFEIFFTKTNSSWLIYESLKTLVIKSSILCNLFFASNTFDHSFLFLILIIYLYVLIPATVARLLNPIAELVVPVGIPSKETKAEIETHSVIAETNIRKCLE